MRASDEQILSLLIDARGDTHAVAEHLCDGEVAAGEYDGCSSDLEMAFAEHQARAERILREAGGMG